MLSPSLGSLAFHSRLKSGARCLWLALQLRTRRNARLPLPPWAVTLLRTMACIHDLTQAVTTRDQPVTGNIVGILKYSRATRDHP